MYVWEVFVIRRFIIQWLKGLPASLTHTNSYMGVAAVVITYMMRAMFMSCRAVAMSLWRRDVTLTGDVTAASNLFKEAPAKRLSIR